MIYNFKNHSVHSYESCSENICILKVWSNPKKEHSVRIYSSACHFRPAWLSAFCETSTIEKCWDDLFPENEPHVWPYTVTDVRRQQYCTMGWLHRYRHSSPIYWNMVTLCFLQSCQNWEAENFFFRTQVAPTGQETDVKQTVVQMSSNIQSDRDNTLYRHAPLPLEFIHKTIVFGFGERAANKTGKRQLVYWKHHLYWKTGWINQWRNLAFNEWLCHLSKVFEMKACPWSSKVKCSRTEYTDFKNRPITQWGMYTWSRLINGL